MGRAIEPVIAPLGFDWKMGIGIVSSFAAREVFVSTMSTVYNVGSAGESDVRQTGAGPDLAGTETAGRVAALYAAAGDHVDGVLRLCAAMREHGGRGPAGNQFLEMAGVSMALHGRPGVDSGIHHLARRTLAGLGLRHRHNHPTDQRLMLSDCLDTSLIPLAIIRG